MAKHPKKAAVDKAAALLACTKAKVAAHLKSEATMSVFTTPKVLASLMMNLEVRMQPNMMQTCTPLMSAKEKPFMSKFSMRMMAKTPTKKLRIARQSRIMPRSKR